MLTPEGCRRQYGSGHICSRNPGHNGEHLCNCGVPSAVYLVTRPGTQVQLEVAVPRRTRPCWRCRLRSLARRKTGFHWNCSTPPDMHYVR